MNLSLVQVFGFKLCFKLEKSLIYRRLNAFVGMEACFQNSEAPQASAIKSFAGSFVMYKSTLLL